MIDNAQCWRQVGIEFIILTRIKPSTVERIEHALGHALLTIGRSTQKIDHTAGHRTQDCLVVLEHLSIGFTIELTLDRKVRDHHER